MTELLYTLLLATDTCFYANLLNIMNFAVSYPMKKNESGQESTKPGGLEVVNAVSAVEDNKISF